MFHKMNVIESQPQISSHLDLDITFQDLVQKIQTSGQRSNVLDAAKIVFNNFAHFFKPAVVYQWLKFEPVPEHSCGTLIHSSENHQTIEFGHSIQFLTKARQVLIGVLTAGPEPDLGVKDSKSASHLLDTYFLDLIGLTILEKVSDLVKDIAQKKAAASGWGVSPFLSPGSVHGWELPEQKKLCAMLPVDQINVKIKDTAVLLPFKSISCLIGIGPDYDESLVGSTCQVCSKRDDCQMRTGENKTHEI